MKEPALRRLSTVLAHLYSSIVLLAKVALLLCAPLAHSSELNVMVNESVMVNELNRTELRQIFTGHRQYWSDGTKITVFVLQDSNELHKQFCREVLHMFPYQLSRLWDQITYSGQGVTPVRVSSYQELVKALERTSGAIGYVEQSDFLKLRRVEVGI
ncbi:substrate-binding domain-containing protein [Alteromonas gracilis]|uniref:substrate-binding domain-containing protein n=1 Tax=Alteromonas gracilis TaxID=1479524 RepID=UPI003734ECD0